MVSKRLSSVPKREIVYQFRVSLYGLSPEIWRRITVPSYYTFWDLHVAIQDAMGWLDYHLHLFEISDKTGKKSLKVGIPDEDFGQDLAAGWEVAISEHFTRLGQTAAYDYDFGDSWRHEILFEGMLLGDAGSQYPRCLGGERACPPEDCGGEAGYKRLLSVLADPAHEDRKETVRWLKGHAKNYHPFKPEKFDPRQVVFSDPKVRWKEAFEPT